MYEHLTFPLYGSASKVNYFFVFKSGIESSFTDHLYSKMDNKEANVVVITKFIAYFPPSILLFGRGITAKEGLFFNML